jgi:hypothetical protein
VPTLVSSSIAPAPGVFGPGSSLTFTFVFSENGAAGSLALFEAPNTVSVGDDVLWNLGALRLSVLCASPSLLVHMDDSDSL